MIRARSEAMKSKSKQRGVKFLFNYPISMRNVIGRERKTHQMYVKFEKTGFQAIFFIIIFQSPKGMGRTYAKFLFSTADFQVKFYAGRFCAKIFLSKV